MKPMHYDDILDQLVGLNFGSSERQGHFYSFNNRCNETRVGEFNAFQCNHLLKRDNNYSEEIDNSMF